MTGLDRPLEPLTALQGFRERLHGAMRRRRDALFDLADMILTTGPVPSPVHLSLGPAHRRGWVSLYTPLAKRQIDEADAREEAVWGATNMYVKLIYVYADSSH